MLPNYASRCSRIPLYLAFAFALLASSLQLSRIVPPRIASQCFPYNAIERVLMIHNYSAVFWGLMVCSLAFLCIDRSGKYANGYFSRRLIVLACVMFMVLSFSIFATIESYAYFVLRPQEDRRHVQLRSGIDEALLDYDFRGFVRERGRYPNALQELLLSVGVKRYIWDIEKVNGELIDAHPICDYYGNGLKSPVQANIAPEIVLLVYHTSSHNARLVFFGDHKLRWVSNTMLSEKIKRSKLIQSELRQQEILHSKQARFVN